MLKKHSVGIIFIVAGIFLINHFFLAHDNNQDYPPLLLIGIFITLTVGFGVMTGKFLIKNI